MDKMPPRDGDTSRFELPHRRSPSIVWIELTSRCPLRCVFCSRETLRGEGEDMPLATVEAILAALQRPEIIRLNYAGESGNYPHLIEAIQLAKDAGGLTEMVTSLVSIPARVVDSLASSGIDRISISLHSLRPEKFRSIYGAASIEQFFSRLNALAEARALSTKPLAIDFAMVVMRDNVMEIEAVAALAAEFRAPLLSLHPVIRREGVPYVPVEELQNDGSLTENFRREIEKRVEAAGSAHRGLQISIARTIDASDPAGGSMVWCEQNPFETVHILANGDVVPCEVLDRRPMGNVNESSVNEVWNSREYALFREAYARGAVHECRSCIFRQTSTTVGPLRTSWGWHARDGCGMLWSHPQCAFSVSAGDNAYLEIRGFLPRRNKVRIAGNANNAANYENPANGPQEFTAVLALSPNTVNHFTAEVEHAFCPWRDGSGGDTRSLGFALLDVRFTSSAVMKRHRPKASIRAVVGSQVRALASSYMVSRFREEQPRRQAVCNRPADSRSVIIPERGSPAMLAGCLAALERAIAGISMPTETIVLVNGAAQSQYSGLARQYRGARFLFSRVPLGFSAAVSRALGHATGGWTYLLNSDVVLDQNALQEALRHRLDDVFAVASRVVNTNETNYTAIHVANGIANLVELGPPSGDGAFEHAYCGGSSSLFRTDMLRRLASRTRCYDPFYWEDAEWGVRARAMGWRCLFAPRSIAHHEGHATISRYYDPAEVRRIFERNRMLFQLRCMPEENPEALRERIRNSPRRTLLELLALCG